MPPLTRVLILDADRARGAAMHALLGAAGYDTRYAGDVGSLTDQPAIHADVVLASLDDAGPEGLARLATAVPTAEIVMLTCAGREAHAREALRYGAADVVVRERGSDVILAAVERAAGDGARRAELALLRARVGDRAAQALVGRSTSMIAVRELIGRASASRATVSVTGEAGTGKDVVSRLIHDLSDRAPRPFVVVRCGDMPAEAMLAELFGSGREGLLERARGGTLVVEEPGRMPRPVRERLGPALAEHVLRRGEPGVAGGAEHSALDLRLIFTVRTPSSPARAETPELLGERSVLPIFLPPLRERRSDIPALVKHFLDRIAADAVVRPAPPHADQMASLLGHEWPGNVRELEHWVERMAYAGPTAGTAPSPLAPGSEFAALDRLSLADLERRYILYVLAQERGHQSRTAARLGIDRRTLYRKLREYREDDAASKRAAT